MRTFRTFLGLMVIIGILAGPSLGADLGDKAAPLKIAEWIKGGPVDMAKGKDKTIYVVEFWATWCPPCRQAIPHLTELQKKYKDKGVVVISVSDESPRVVKAFVDKQGSKMDFVVAADKNRATSAAYMQAFRQGSIPHAFIVDKKGRIVWHGHPMAALDQILGEVVEGTYDVEKAMKIAQASGMMAKYFELAVEGTEKKKADELGKQIIADAGSSFELMDRFAWAILSAPQIKYRDLDLAMTAAETGYKACNGKNASMVDTYARALFQAGKIGEALKLQQQALELVRDPRLKAEMQQRLKEYEAKVVANPA